jgi:putative transcriptional regulator
MSRSALIGNVTAMLSDAGFTVSQRIAVRPKSFDVAARRGDELLLLKVLGNVDAFDRPSGHEMRRLGTYLEATPMVIGLRTRDEDLKPGVVYFRHGVPVLSPDTAMDLFLEGVPPLIYAAPGGLYVNIDSDILADEREERGWSLGRLAQELGVSRRTVSKYEDGMNASVEVAAKLEEVFSEDLTGPVSVLDGAEDVRDADPTPDDPSPSPDEEPIVAALTAVGLRVHPTERAPFHAVGEDGEAESLLTGHTDITPDARKRAKIMSSLGAVTRSHSVYFVEEASRETLEGTAVVERDEAADFEEADELRKLIEERSDSEESSA